MVADVDHVDDLLRVVTHTSRSDIMSGYTRATWPALCGEIAKLRVSILDGEVLPLGTARSTLDANIAKRWRQPAASTGIAPACG